MSDVKRYGLRVYQNPETGKEWDELVLIHDGEYHRHDECDREALAAERDAAQMLLGDLVDLIEDHLAGRVAMVRSQLRPFYEATGTEIEPTATQKHVVSLFTEPTE